jgi:two-component system LytT family response regulator
MKVMLVDDESAALQVLSSMLSIYEDIEILGSYTNPLDALEASRKAKPDVVFLDIEMGTVNGLETAELFSGQGEPEIVFITAYSQYAVEAFEVNAMDYLLKPIQERRLHRTVQRLRAKNKSKMLLEEEYSHAQDPPANGLIISSLGNFEVSSRKGEKVYWRTQKGKELFIYLWIHNSTFINKSVIMEVVFPDKNLTSATALLHTTIYQIRKALESLGFPKGIVYANEGYKLLVPVESDVESLNLILGLKTYSHRDISAILDIYNGDLLEQEGYSWAIGIQESLRNSVYTILEEYALQQLSNKEIIENLDKCLELMYKLNPFSETMAKLMIDFLGIQRKKPELKRFFKRFTHELWEEMGIRPMESIVVLYKGYLNEL